MCPQLTAVTPVRLCIHPATLPLGTCTLRSDLAETRSMNTHSISLALPTLMERPQQAGRNSHPTWCISDRVSPQHYSQEQELKE